MSARPLLRGVSHQFAFVASLATGSLLVASSRSPVATVAAAIFAASVAAMFGASALYHRVNWSATAARWMRCLDHTGIFLVIGGSYMPYALLVLSGPLRIAVITLVWTGVVAGVALRFAWVSAPGWLTVTLGVALGWASLIALPELLQHINPIGLTLLGLGGLLYTLGAIVYATRWPNPLPAVFGFHEVFHLFVIAAVACQYASIAFFVLPNH
ncbi:MAG TPA: hemolysin III family protein [Actinomycetes bacterium]|nr:hemolysin III family protein [Actinomycetes bacterium]